jgi:hypothetical protein
MIVYFFLSPFSALIRPYSYKLGAEPTISRISHMTVFYLFLSPLFLLLSIPSVSMFITVLGGHILVPRWFVGVIDLTRRLYLSVLAVACVCITPPPQMLL